MKKKSKKRLDRRWAFAQHWVNAARSVWLAFACDAFKALRLIPDGTIDLIITDPPYASLEKHRDSKRRIREYERKKAAGELEGTRIPRLRDWFKIMPNEMIPTLIAELYRVMADDSHCYIFCDDETSDLIAEAVKAQVEEHGAKNAFKWWKRIVWDKKHRGQGYHYANQHEFIVFLEKGKRKLNSLKHPSVLPCKRVSKKSLGGREPGPTEKPVSLCEIFVTNSSNPGDLVFDPFCGTGAVGVAAVMNGREFLGFDLKLSSVHVARDRLREAMEAAA